VLLWIEEQVALNRFSPPLIRIHSANVSARQKMQLTVEKIMELAARGMEIDRDDRRERTQEQVK